MRDRPVTLGELKEIIAQALAEGRAKGLVDMNSIYGEIEPNYVQVDLFVDVQHYVDRDVYIVWDVSISLKHRVIYAEKCIKDIANTYHYDMPETSVKYEFTEGQHSVQWFLEFVGLVAEQPTEPTQLSFL